MSERGSWASRLFKSAMLRGTSFSDAHGKLKTLYTVEDPWDMASEREQYRFQETNRQLTEVAPHFGHVLELGCGEGHQTLHLAQIANQISGIELSPKAVARAQARCPEGTFRAGQIEAVRTLFPNTRFDLITGCEVLYYVSDLESVLQSLYGLTERLYVSNYAPRAARMESALSGLGWRPLAPIHHQDTTWECRIWEATQAG
ncbi:MAG: class I SAM-dependent methyltransferase [Pseudomonadota bacterium]